MTRSSWQPTSGTFEKINTERLSIFSIPFLCSIQTVLDMHSYVFLNPLFYTRIPIKILRFFSIRIYVWSFLYFKRALNLVLRTRSKQMCQRCMHKNFRCHPIIWILKVTIQGDLCVKKKRVSQLYTCFLRFDVLHWTSVEFEYLRIWQPPQHDRVADHKD